MTDIYYFKPVPEFPVEKGLPISVASNDYNYHEVELDYIPEMAPHYTANELFAMFKNESPEILNYFGLRVFHHGPYYTHNEELRRCVPTAWFLGFVPGTLKTRPCGGVAVPEWGSYASDEADSYTLVPPSKKVTTSRELFSLTLEMPIVWDAKEGSYIRGHENLVVRRLAPDVPYCTIRLFLLNR